MKPKPKARHQWPLRVPMDFDEAIRRALTVKPPAEGWAEDEKKHAKTRKRRRANKAA